MTDLDKRKKRRKKLLKSKKGGAIATFIVFVIISALLTGLFVLMAILTSEATIKNILVAELDKATYIRRTYAAANDGEKDLSILKNSEMDYILLDKQGNVISQAGKDTRKKKGEEYILTTSFTSDDEKLTDEELTKNIPIFSTATQRIR